MSPAGLQEHLRAHLAWWGLRQFTSDADYFGWQRQTLSPAELSDLHRNVERKRQGTSENDIAFYDTTARPTILPVLYSQRYDYFLAIGPRVTERIGKAESVLDFGCGAGILTTFYAQQCPEKTFMGIDRSPVSIEVAQAHARSLGLTNVRFECADVAQQALSGNYDLVLATHALVQAEHDPGLPSRDWTTFERSRDESQQRVCEALTGIGPRLDRLSAALNQGGRMMVFEKTRQLARRVPFQRALAGRELQLVEPPEPIRYRLVEEVADDGPFYVLCKGTQGNVPWDESPEPDEGPVFDRALLQAGPGDPEQPLYENHWPSAQRMWEQLLDRRILQETTRRETDGRQVHVELGTAEGGAYLYCANTFDQRQLVIVEPARVAMLDTYYEEIIRGSL